MATKKCYSSKEEYERRTPYVTVEAPCYNGVPVGPAGISGSFTSRKVAKNNTQLGEIIMTRKQAIKFIEKWNKDFEDK
jgi:hypothetical protein